jgi:hypothetical protein
MKFLIVFLSGSLAFATTLTMDLDVRENLAPSRHANLSVSDGTNSLQVDLYRSYYPGEITQLGYCRGGSFGCTLPGGDLNQTGIFLNSASLFNALALGGIAVPFAEWGDYSISFSFNFTGGTPITSLPWGPQPLNADLNIAIIQLSTGNCVFCGHAPLGAGTASGDADPAATNFPDYRFEYQAFGEIVTEPPPYQLGILGTVAWFAALCRRRAAFIKVSS